jgi:hypothetical protein
LDPRIPSKAFILWYIKLLFKVLSLFHQHLTIDNFSLLFHGPHPKYQCMFNIGSCYNTRALQKQSSWVGVDLIFKFFPLLNVARVCGLCEYEGTFRPGCKMVDHFMLLNSRMGINISEDN